MRAFLSHLQTLSRFSLFAVYINQHIRVSVEYLPQALCNLTIYAWLANLYLRLSKEDKRSANAESISIETQRMKTTNFAKQNSIIIRKEFVDDGESGVFFERPEFQAMMHDVEEGNANCIIVKDLSRLGRNDVQANLYYEDIFIARGIRFIAIDDGVDT